MKLWKRILFLSITFLVIYFVYKNRLQLLQVYQVLTSGLLRWLFLAIVMQVAGFYFLIRAHKFSLEAVKIKRTIGQLAPLLLASLVVNTTAPTAGATGTILFANDATEKGDSPYSAAIGILLSIVSYFYGLLGILLIVLIYIHSVGEIGASEIIFTLILFLMTAGFSLCLYFAYKKRVILERFFNQIAKNFSKILKLFHVKSDNSWIKLTIDELSSVAKTIKNNPKKILEIVLMQMATHISNVLCLFFLFLAFGETTKFGVIISGYAIGELFRNASPAPEGVGVTEGSMAILFTSFGIDPIDSTAIALAYRGLNFWIPFGIGFTVLQAKHLFPEKKKKS